VSTLADLFHYWGNDLVASPTGDLATVSGTLRGQQRVLRRLLTNSSTVDANGNTIPGDYIWEPNYGAGLPSFLGQPIDTQKIQAVILSQMLLEEAVAPTPAPLVVVTQTAADNTAFTVSISYNDADTNTPVTLSFNVSM
jgi:hypothetical protein